VTIDASRTPVGLVLGSHMPPPAIAPMASLAEELGFGELWFSEDCFFSGAFAGATAALAATSTLPLGLGIVSAQARHPAILAMELATLDLLFPGRIYGGIGHGVSGWLDQMGLQKESPLKVLRQCLTAVRRLLDGEQVTETGPFHFDEIGLTYPAATRVPLYTGVVGERGLQMSGAVADGTILSVLASPAYVSWARAQVTAGAVQAGRSAPHRLVTYTLFSVDRDREVARNAVRDSIAFYLAAMPNSALTQVYGIRDEVNELLAIGGAEAIAKEMPDSWIDDLAVAGDPEECAHKIQVLIDAGSDSLGLWLFPTDKVEDLARFTAAEVLTRL
jgi:5,10-methylenetetrahydromethanopterin reductase